MMKQFQKKKKIKNQRKQFNLAEIINHLIILITYDGITKTV